MITKPTYWTEARVLLTLEDMLAQVESEENKAFNKQTLFLEFLFIQRKISPQRLSEWVDKFKDNDEISEAIYMLKKILEYRVVDATTKNKLNSFMVIFHLKNNYAWRDESTVHDDSKDKQKEDIAEIRNRLATRTRRNIRIKK